MAIGVGSGIYTPAEASRLTGLPVRKVRGWISGYRRYDGTHRSGRPLVSRDPSDGPVLSFLDLIEILFVRSFLKYGVKMSHIRQVSRKAAEISGSHHPFAVSRFETDGKKIFARLVAKGSRKKHVLGLLDGQSEIDEAISPYFKQIDYRSSGDATRWWPLGKKAPVFLDPLVAFGAPVTKSGFVPVSAINGALSAGETPSRVAHWFDIPLRDVKAAAAFKQRIAA